MKVIIQENMLYKGRRYKKGDVACIDDCAALIDRGLVEAPKVLGSATIEHLEPKPVNMPFIETVFIEEKPKKGRPKKK